METHHLPCCNCYTLDILSIGRLCTKCDQELMHKLIQMNKTTCRNCYGSVFEQTFCKSYGFCDECFTEYSDRTVSKKECSICKKKSFDVGKTKNTHLSAILKNELCCIKCESANCFEIIKPQTVSNDTYNMGLDEILRSMVNGSYVNSQHRPNQFSYKYYNHMDVFM
jgi:hypothetical protein